MNSFLYVRVQLRCLVDVAPKFWLYKQKFLYDSYCLVLYSLSTRSLLAPLRGLASILLHFGGINETRTRINCHGAGAGAGVGTGAAKH